MKTQKIILSLFVINTLFSCNKQKEDILSLNAEDKKHYSSMQEYLKMAEDYELTLENCTDSATCNLNYTDSMYHYCISQWEEHHNFYSHQNEIDDHDHEGGMIHEHMHHCGNDSDHKIPHHTLNEHRTIDSLKRAHINYIH